MAEPANLKPATAVEGGPALTVCCGTASSAAFRLGRANWVRCSSSEDASTLAADGAGAADSDADQVRNECLRLLVLAFVKLGTAIEASSSTSAAAIPNGTSHRTGRRRGGANSFGATVLKCWSSFWRRCSLSLSGVGWSAVCAAGQATVSRTRLTVCLSRS